jgi:hypothetical protein
VKDRLKIRQVFDAFILAQMAFDDRVAGFKKAYDAAELAMQAKTTAASAMSDQLAEVDRLAAELTDMGAVGPDILVEEEMASSVRRGRELGEIYAHLEACRPKQNGSL